MRSRKPKEIGYLLTQFPEILLNILSKLSSIKDVARFSLVNKKLYEQIQSTQWNCRATDSGLKEEHSFSDVCKMSDVDFHVRYYNQSLKKKILYLDNLNVDVDSPAERQQIKCSCEYGCGGFLCGAMLSYLCVDKLYPAASCVLGALFCLGCFVSEFNEEEKRFEEETHQSRNDRHAKRKTSIESQRRGIKERLKLLPPVCELITSEENQGPILRKSKSQPI